MTLVTSKHLGQCGIMEILVFSVEDKYISSSLFKQKTIY